MEDAGAYLLNRTTAERLVKLLADEGQADPTDTPPAPFRASGAALVKCGALVDEDEKIYDGMIVRALSASDPWDELGDLQVRLQDTAGTDLVEGKVYVAVAGATSDFTTPASPGDLPLYFTGGGAGLAGSIVRATEDGSPADCYVQEDDGAGGLQDTLSLVSVKKLPSPAREDFETNGYYFAVKVGPQWWGETGPKSKCVEVVTSDSTATLDCDTGGITFSGTVKIRVIDRACP